MKSLLWATFGVFESHKLSTHSEEALQMTVCSGWDAMHVWLMTAEQTP